jgi:MFS family permease
LLTKLTASAGNAVVFGLVDSLGLVGIEFNNLSMLFYVLYIVFEIPWVMAVKRFGPNKVLAIALVSWSAVTIGTGFIHNYHQAIACRLLLGLTEAGTVPALTFIVSTIYNRHDQAKRIATLYIASAASGAFGGLIAYGIQSMGARHGLEAWRWLFIVEGIISIVLGGICWLSLPSSPERAWFLNQEEREMMAARKRRNLLYKGSDEFSWSWVRMAFKDPFVYGAAAAMFCSTIPLYGLATFLPTIIRGLGYVLLLLLLPPLPPSYCFLFGASSLRLTLEGFFSNQSPFKIFVAPSQLFHHSGIHLCDDCGHHRLLPVRQIPAAELLRHRRCLGVRRWLRHRHRLLQARGGLLCHVSRRGRRVSFQQHGHYLGLEQHLARAQAFRRHPSLLLPRQQCRSGCVTDLSLP